MTELSVVTVVLGGLLAVLYGAMVLAPRTCLAAASAFPRNRISAWLLTVIVLGWSGILIYQSPLGGLEAYRGLLYLLVPVAIILVGLFVDELLGPRALGGLLLLIPAVILDAARWHPSPWRYVMTITAYILVLKGCTLVMVPYVFRKVCERYMATPGRCRMMGGAGLLVAALFLVLGLFVY